jgi:hypothetical protein
MLVAGNGKHDLIAAIAAEAQPDALVNAAVSLVQECQRPLPIEKLILAYYARKPDTLLPRASLRNLVSYLLHCGQKSRSRDKLLFCLCRSQTEEVARFYNVQPKDNKRLLRPFIPVEKLARPVAVKPPRSFLLENRSQHELKTILAAEQKKGPKGNFKLYVSAIRGIKVRDFEARLRLFERFLGYLAILPIQMIKANEQTLDELCAEVFGNRRFMEILSQPFVLPDVLLGLACFVWHCPMAVLAEGDVYYPRLYEIFRDSESEHRSAVIRIAIAIEKVTNTSILSLIQITKQHQAIMNTLILQYEVRDDRS